MYITNTTQSVPPKQHKIYQNNTKYTKTTRSILAAQYKIRTKITQHIPKQHKKTLETI